MRCAPRPGARRIRLGASICAAAFVLVVGPPAGASCSAPPPSDDALASQRAAFADVDDVFVGKVVATRSLDRIAAVVVEEVWKGRATSRVVVHGGPSDESSISSGDRTYARGTTYLFFTYDPSARGIASRGGGGRYEDSACSATAPLTPELAALRPATAAAPAAPARRATPGVLPAGAAALLLAAGVGLVAVLRARRR